MSNSEKKPPGPPVKPCLPAGRPPVKFPNRHQPPPVPRYNPRIKHTRLPFARRSI